MKQYKYIDQFVLLIPLAALLIALPVSNVSAQNPPDCFTPDNYTLWVYTEPGSYICNSNQYADGTEYAYLGWDSLEVNDKVTLWIFMGPDYDHPDYGWRAYTQPDSTEWGDCDYSGLGAWLCSPSIGDLNEWGADFLDIYPEFSSPGSYQVTGTHPGWTCSGGQCGTTVSGGNDSIYIVLIRPENTAVGLFQSSSGSNLINPGRYVHFNTDNDNDNNNWASTPPSNSAILDYTETASVTNENDLQQYTISINPFIPTMGTVTLSRSNSSLRVWSNSTKGAAAAVLTTNNSISWDLSNPTARTIFNNIKNNLWIEGCNTGDANLLVTYTAPSTCGYGTSGQLTSYHFIAAMCDPYDHLEYSYVDYNKTPPEIYKYEPWVKTLHPNIIHCEWSKTADVNGDYNCIAFVLDIQSRSIFPEDMDSNGDDILTNSEALSYFQSRNLTQITTGSEIEKANQAKVIYYPTPSDWNYVQYQEPPGGGFHAAKRKTCSCGAGKWIMYESKIGYQWFRMEHVWDQLDGGKYDGGSKYFLQ